MRTLPAVVLTASLLFASTVASAQPQPSPAASPAPPYAAKASERVGGIDKGLLAAGAGAIAGIALFNTVTGPFAVVPLAGAELAAVPYEVAYGSRMIAALSGAIGGVLASEAYDAVTGSKHDYGYASALILGAAGGVFVVNSLSGWGGTLPYYTGVGQAFAGTTEASTAGQAASRIYVIASGVLGAWAADWLWNVSEKPTPAAP